MAERRAVYEAIWGVHLDGANFLRGVVTEDGWVIPTGGKPAELYRAGRMWKYSSPIWRSQPTERRRGNS
jgi:8-oxo-dGTP diphosphatase